MNIYTAKDMSLDQIRSEYRKYLQQKGLSSGLSGIFTGAGGASLPVRGADSPGADLVYL